MQSVSSASDAEKLLLYHGERIVDLLGAEINQIERSIQVQYYTCIYTMYMYIVGCMIYVRSTCTENVQEKFPTVRHIDIEIN